MMGHNLTVPVNRFMWPVECTFLEYFHFCLVKLIFCCQFCNDPVLRHIFHGLVDKTDFTTIFRTQMSVKAIVTNLSHQDLFHCQKIYGRRDEQSKIMGKGMNSHQMIRVVQVQSQKEKQIGAVT